MGYPHYITHEANPARRASILATNEVAEYPARNAILLPVDLTARMDIRATNRLYLTFAGATSVDTAALVAHNLSPTAVVTVRAGATWDANTLSQALTWRRRTLWGRFTAASHQYWAFDIADDANEYGFIEIGYVVLGVATELACPVTISSRRDAVVNLQSLSETSAPIERHLVELEEIALDFRHVSATEFAPWRSLVLDLGRRTSGALVIPNPAEADALFGRPDREVRRDALIPRLQAPDTVERSSSRVTLVEDPPGIIVVDSLPELTAGEPLPDGWTHTRASTAYYKNSDLALVQAASGEYRHTHYWDYGLYGSLVEGAAGTQLHTFTEDLSNAAWTKQTGVTIDANSADEPVASPAGLMDGIIERDGVTQTHYVCQNITITADADVCAAVYARAGTRGWLLILVREVADSGNRFQAWFDLQNGVVANENNIGTATGVRAYIEPMTDGVYRCCIAGNIGNGATSIRSVYCLAIDGSTNNYEGVAGSPPTPAIYLWGMHAEQAGWPSSYIPRLDATAATRAADSLSIPWPASAQGRAVTIYSRMVEIGHRYLGANPRFWQIGNAGVNADPRLISNVDTTSKIYNTVYRTAAGTVSQSAATLQAVGAMIELRQIVYPEGASRTGLSVNGGTETVTAKGTARGLEVYGDTLRVAAAPDGAAGGLVLLQSLRCAHGVQSLEYMRRL